MSNNPAYNHDSETELQLDRHTAALRQTPVSDGPSPQTFAATLAMLNASSSNAGGDAMIPAGDSSNPIERWLHMKRFIPKTTLGRIAALVLVSIGAVALFASLARLSSFGTSVAFADVAEKLKAARTMSFTTSATLPGQPTVQIKVFMADPDRMRTEMPMGMVSIINHGDILILNSTAHTATRLEMTNMAKPKSDPEMSMVQDMRDMWNHKGEPIGVKTIEGVETTGFRTTLGGNPATVWADAKTALPVRIETNTQIHSMDVVTVMDHFQIDPPLDDAMFSTQTPAGYTQSVMHVANPKQGALINDIASLLGDYAKLADGEFPASLTMLDYERFIKEIGKDDIMQLAVQSGSIDGRLFSLRQGYTYVGKGVKLGDKDRLVFWYQPDAAKPAYKAIYADLHIADVTADALPTTQPTQP